MRGKLSALLSLSLLGATTLMISYGSMVGVATRAEAGVCYNLWYQRNAIFAARGYCFKGCGKRVWGKNCFGPFFGKLTPGQWSSVNQIKAQERALGCPSCPTAAQ